MIHEAQRVVVEADSLWHNGQMYGIDAGDSAKLAQAYEKLGAIPFPILEGFGLNNTFTRSCYHYGKLLRKKDNPVEAMQAFIRATHAHSQDYHYLGRVYSNMGDICHIAGDFELSYDMFEKSAEMFLKNGDTLMYYYDLNNMAFELAEQGKKKETFALLSYITKSSSNIELLTKTLETKARIYLKCNQYDSTVYYSKLLLTKDLNYSAAILLTAQAYSFLGKGDSASFYAENVLTHTHELLEINNALYILTHNDNTKNIKEVRQVSADRSDVQKLIEIRQGKLSQAVQLLEQDMQHKPDLLWLYAVLSTLVLVGTGIIVYVQHKRKKRKLITQQIEVLEQVSLEMQEKHNELSDSYLTDHQRIVDEINSRCSVLQTDESIKHKLAWRNYARLCKIVDEHFYLLATKLRERHLLKETEIRICILTLLDCKNDMMAELLYKSPTSIGTMKRRVANKLGTTSINLRAYLIDNVCIK